MSGKCRSGFFIKSTDNAQCLTLIGSQFTGVRLKYFFIWIGKVFSIEIICGISSVVYFMSQIGLSWDDAKITSVHGKNCNLVSMIKQNQKVFSNIKNHISHLIFHQFLCKFCNRTSCSQNGKNLLILLDHGNQRVF